MCELLRANLYEFQKYNRENGDEPYFTLPHLQRIAQQASAYTPSSYCLLTPLLGQHSLQLQLQQLSVPD